MPAEDTRGAFDSARDKLVDAILSLIGAPHRAQQQTLARIHAVLGSLADLLMSWAEDAIQEKYTEAEARARAELADFEEPESEPESHKAEFIALVLASFRDAALAALHSIDLLAQAAIRATSTIDLLPPNIRQQLKLAETVGQTNTELIAQSTLRQQLLGGIVQIIGKDGRAYHFDLDYYMQLIQQSALNRADTEAVLALAKSLGFDLVVVSPNPSTIGDYCDAYRGKVFSISGADSRFPRLADTPNGGPPFHPHCYHWLGLYNSEGKTDEELASVANVDPQFLLHGENDSANRIWHDWNQRGTHAD